MNGLMIPNASTGPGKKLKALLDSATHPDNILIEVMPDRTLIEACGLNENDGVVIDRGLTLPHSGGSYYLIHHGELEQIRRIIAMPDNKYLIGNDHTCDSVSRDSVHVIGMVIGWVNVRIIH